MRAAKALLIALFLVVPVSLALGQTGKISGQVTDESTGDALPGVNVVIEGTTIGAVTAADGYYDIINVRPGNYQVRVSFIGYTSKVVDNVDVNIGLTTTLNVTLSEATVGLDEVIVTAEQPVIQRDVSASQRTVDEVEIQFGRYQDVNNVLTAQVGINEVGAYEDRPEIRGSNFEESLFLVDGVSQGDALTNQPYFKVNLDAVEEIQVLTGGFSAEYGDVRSGVISVVTKEGGEQYSGSANVSYSAPAQRHWGPNVYAFDSPIVDPFVNPASGAFTGNDFFEGWNEVAASLGQGDAHAGSPNELYALYLWRHRSEDSINELKRLESEGLVRFAPGINPDDQVFHEYGVLPDVRASFTFGGPIPFVRPVKFFVSYDRTETEYSFRFPQANYREGNVRAKITTNVAPGMKLNLSGFFSRQSGGDGGQGPGIGGFVSSNPFVATGGTNKLWYSHCAVAGERDRSNFSANWTHTLNANTFYEITATHNREDYKMLPEFRNTIPIPGNAFGANHLVNGRLGTEAQINSGLADGSLGQEWANWEDYAVIQIGDVWYDEAPKGYGPVNWRDVTGYYRMESCNLRVDETASRGYEFASSLTSQINRFYQVKAGFDVRYDDLQLFYQAVDPSVNGGTTWDSSADPWRGAVYAQNKLEFGGFIANVGLRLDWHVSGEFPVLDLENPDAANSPYAETLLAGNTTDDEGRIDLDQKLPTERVSTARVSPRIGVSHPITTRAKIFFNYGHFYQWPNALDQYAISIQTSRGSIIDDYGNPNLAPPRTIAYELGYEQNLFDRVSLRLTGYYKDINDEDMNVDYFPLGYGGRSMDIRLNGQFRDVRGLEAFTELRRGTIPYFSGWASLNWLSESEGEFGFDRFYEDPSRQPRRVNAEVSSPDVRPIIKLNFNFYTPSDLGPTLGNNASLLGDWNLNLLYTWQRGKRFTWNPEDIPLVENNIRWRPFKRWDLRLTKELFTAGRFRTSFYLDVTNLFNQRNMTPFRVGQDDDDDQFNREDENWAWSGHQWFRNQEQIYMESLGITVNTDGSIDGDLRPGDWEEDQIDRPDFTPFTFLDRRDIFFGVRLNF